MAPFCLLPAPSMWFYNRAMRSALLFALSILCIGVCRGESPAPAPTPPDLRDLPAPASAKVVEQRTERIHVEDVGASIDELRVGGETRSITVQPKGGLPAYEVSPASGERNWKFLSF